MKEPLQTTVAASPVRRIPVGEFVVETPSGSVPFDQSTAGTRRADTLFSRFGTFVLPFATAVALFAPVAEGRMRRYWSSTGRSATEIADVVWILDDWVYTTEPADPGQVALLNDLLALQASEGLVLDITD